MPFAKTKRRVVVIGGGTGSYTVLRGLKQYADTLEIAAIVSMADAGGSTGRLRDEFGYLPVGDVRMALAALAREDTARADLLRQLFLHRFARGTGLNGHNVGNLLLVALTDLLGSEAAAVRTASSILNIHGTVLPVTADNVHLVAAYDDGVVVTGEHRIDDPPPDRHNRRIAKLSTDPVGRITAEAEAAILQADLIIIGPGDLYSSLIANLVIDGVSAALCRTRARLAFVSGLMERPGQTRGLRLSEMTAEIARYSGRSPDFVCINTAPLPEAVLTRYVAQGDYPVTIDRANLAGQLVEADLLAERAVQPEEADAVRRSLIRHDSQKLAKMLIGLLE